MGEQKTDMPAATKPGRPADVRGALVIAAREELLTQGAMGLSVRAVARRVGVSHQATVHHFGDRAGLLTEVAILGLRQLSDRLTEATGQLPPTASPQQQIVVMGVAYSHFAAQYPPLIDLMFSDDLGKAGAETLHTAQLEVWQLLLGAFEEASERGFGGDADAQGLAVAAWAFVHGLATLSRGPIGIVAGDLPMEAVVTNLALAVGITPKPVQEQPDPSPER